jgi:hypothetical protein
MRLQFQLAFFVGHGTRDNVRVHDPRALVNVVGFGLRHVFLKERIINADMLFMGINHILICHWKKIDRLKWEPAPPPNPIHDHVHERVVIVCEKSAPARRAHRV